MLTARKEAKEKASPTVKICPECLSEIPIKAKRCKFCTAVQPEAKVEEANK